jgi:hypothetical protein
MRVRSRRQDVALGVEDRSGVSIVTAAADAGEDPPSWRLAMIDRRLDQFHEQAAARRLAVRTTAP